MNRSLVGIGLGLRHVLALTLNRFGFVTLGVCSAWTTLFSVIAKNAGISSATTLALIGPVFGIAVPLALFSHARRLASTRLDATAATVSVLGIDAKAFGIGALGGSMALGGALAMLLSLLCVGVIRNFSDPSLLADLLTTGWVGLLGGATYACSFGALAAMGRGLPGFVFLLADWLVGSGQSSWSLLWPRAHVANLLGATALPTSSGTSVLVLWGFCLLGSALFVARLKP